MKTINDSKENSINNLDNNKNYYEDKNLEEIYIEKDNFSNENFKNNLQEILYEDETIQLTRNYLKIFKYYYPLQKAKIIPLYNVKKASIFKLTMFTSKYKFYGLAWDLSWFHLDKKRPLKEFGIKIYDGSLVNCVITPENPKKVYDLINDITKK
jgi:hypothetical protein